MRPRLLGLIGAMAVAVFGQDTALQPTFEVASVKIDNSPFVPDVSGQARGGPGTSDPGRITITQQSLKFIMMRAYGVMADQLYGPAWLDDFSNPKFTITATMPPNTTKEAFQLMLQNLLMERFRIVLHHETRNFPGYDLVLAQGGPKLSKWIPESNPDAGAEPPHGPDERGFPRLRPGQPGDAISITMYKTGMVRSTHRQSLSDFAKRLSGHLNLANAVSIGSAMPRVIDKTGLAGIYEFKLEFEGTAVLPGAASPSIPAGEAGAIPIASDPGSGGPSLFTALEKQLGLKLVKAKSVAVDVLVIDHIEKVPLEN